MLTAIRQGPEWGGGYPISFADVACAIGVARNIGPTYGASPGHLTLVGHSNGGWFAAVVGLTTKSFVPEIGSCNPTAGSLRPDAVVGMAGAYNQATEQLDGAFYVTGFFGEDRKTHPRRVGGR